MTERLNRICLLALLAAVLAATAAAQQATASSWFPLCTPAIAVDHPPGKITATTVALRTPLLESANHPPL
jgi:hypothetical protein